MRHVPLLFSCWAMLLPSAAAAQTSVPAFEVTGRVFVSEPHSCAGVWPDFLTEVGGLSWSECHALKRHVDPAGMRITSNEFVATAWRPFQVTVDVDIRCVYAEGAEVDAVPIRSARTQTDGSGRFRVVVPNSACPLRKPVYKLLVRASASMLYAMDAAGTAATVRALWDRARAASVYSSTLPPAPTVYADSVNDWVIPRFLLAEEAVSIPPPRRVNIGNRTFFEGAAADYTGYLRGAMGAWQTMIMLHERLKGALAVDGHDGMYREMFIDEPATACTACYTVTFATEVGGAGGRGVMLLPRPDPADDFWKYVSLVSVGFPGHEIGHSIQASLAPGSIPRGGGPWLRAMGADGTLTTHRQGVEIQGMPFALVEGFANAVGQLFLSGCRPLERAWQWGASDIRERGWNPISHLSCDASAGCPYHRFRFQMHERGIPEGSATWNARRQSLADLAETAAAGGAIVTFSTEENKVRDFLCDLLDNDSDVSHAAGIRGRAHVPDYPWHVAERLDGREPPVVFATYVSDPRAELVTLSLGRLVDAMAGFVDGAADPGPVPSPMVDGANAVYNDAHVSVRSPYSMQSLAEFLVRKGWVARSDVNGILRGNRMEEIP